MSLAGNSILNNEFFDVCLSALKTAKTLNKMRENMNRRHKIDHLLEEVKREQQIIDNCPHNEWTYPIYDPEDTLVPYGNKQTGAGSDPYWEPEGYTTKQKPRWSRECTKCGKIQYTYTQEPVVTGYKPSFK